MKARPRGGVPVLAAVLALAAAVSARAAWPELSTPAPRQGGGERDAAVIVGIEDYAFVSPVPGARRLADDWQAYLTETLRTPVQRVTLLRDAQATREQIARALAAQAAAVRPGATLWLIFIGHGAPAPDGRDGLLVGADAQATAESLRDRSLRRGEILSLLSRGRQARTVVVLDACFSGRDRTGRDLLAGLQPLLVTPALGKADPRLVLMTAASADQFAGPLPDSKRPRPAFAYLTLGGLRGWAADASGKVEAGALVNFARRALSLAHDRVQTPELDAGAATTVLGRGREPAPDLAAIEREAADSPFQVSSAALTPVPRAAPPGDWNATPLDFRSVDAAAWADYEAAHDFERSDATPGAKSRRWRALAAAWPDASFAAAAKRRAAQWESYAEGQDRTDRARRLRAAARDEDWSKLKVLLGYSVVAPKDKALWADEFASAYMPFPGLTPEMARALAPLLAPGRPRAALEILARDGGDGAASAQSAWAAAGAGVTWRALSVPDSPARDFEISTLPVSQDQYKLCVSAGACRPIDAGDDACSVLDPGRKAGPSGAAICASWRQAVDFAHWVGGRLPTREEWSRATDARGAECRRGSGSQELCRGSSGDWEWTEDWRPPSLAPVPAAGTPWPQAGWASPYAPTPFGMPAGWMAPADMARQARRFDFASGARYRDVVFRVARDPL